MIEEVGFRAAGADRWRPWWLSVFALIIVVTAGFAVGRRIEHGNVAVAAEVSPAPSVPSSAPPSQAPSAGPSLPSTALVESAVKPSPSATRSPVAAGLLQMSGAVPARGSGAFSYAAQRSAVFGAKGSLRRFRVAVEKGSGEDVNAFARQVAATLGDPRSWAGSGQVRLQMVPGSERADFTVFLATRDTAGRMCLRGGTNIRVGGVPYTSCRTSGKAIINLDRWRRSATPHLKAKVPLATYRQYVINHEVGHELGHRHQGCPKAGGPAPVMVQQTLTLRGCKPYAWPLRGGRPFTGPSL